MHFTENHFTEQQLPAGGKHLVNNNKKDLT